jgi:IS30 family transposase
MRAYPRLNEGQRIQIYALKKAGFTQRAIAEQIAVDKSTMYGCFSMYISMWFQFTIYG